jgi:hypothetical protein
LLSMYDCSRHGGSGVPLARNEVSICGGWAGASGWRSG